MKLSRLRVALIGAAILATSTLPATAQVRPQTRPVPAELSPSDSVRPQTRPDAAATGAGIPVPVLSSRDLASEGRGVPFLGPDRSVKPRTRDMVAPAPEDAPPPARPRLRPDPISDAAQTDPVFASGLAFHSMRPRARPRRPVPDANFQSEAAADGSTRPVIAPADRKKTGVLNTIFGPKGVMSPEASMSGAVCGDPSIKGTSLPPIGGAHKGCGIDLPVRVTEVAGVRLSPAATLNCDATRTLKTWITKSLKPAFRGQAVTDLRIYASYACRGRNNVKGARISEHAKGNAIDIGEITTAKRGTLTVLKDFKTSRGAALRKAYKGACGIFGTTLGPGSDGYHENHMHLDIAHYRGGAYCH